MTAPPGTAGAALERGTARRLSGDSVGARAAFLEAARLARQEGDGGLLAEAALGHGQGSGGLHRAVRYDHQHISLLEEALAALPAQDSPLRVRLFARLAEELAFTAEQSARASLAAEAVAMARRLGDQQVLLVARYAQELCRVGPDLPLEERLASTASLVELAGSLGDVEATCLAHLLRELTLLEAGRTQEAVLELDAAAALWDRLEVPAFKAWVLCARSRQAWLRGAFDDAERLNAEALDRALERGGDPDVAELVVGGQLLSQQLLRYPVGPYVPALREYRQQHPHVLVLTCFLAYALAGDGDLAAARTLLDELAPDGCLELPRTTEWGTAVWALARCADLLDDVPLAVLLQAQLSRSSTRWFADWSFTSLGPVEATLGLLAAVRRRWDEAERHFTAAVQQAREAGSPPWVADAQVAFAQALLRKGEPSDLALARVLLDEAVTTCDTLGMGFLGGQARALLVP